MRPHETSTASGITIPDPDQGTPVIGIQFAMPSTEIMVFEPFAEEDLAQQPELEKCGHNLPRFAGRWEEWIRSREPFLVAIDPRFGYQMLIPRSAIPQVVQIYVKYHRKEDVRAGVRGGGMVLPGQPTVRALGNGAYEIGLPR